MTRVEIFRENEWTTDGRLVHSVVWNLDPLLLYVPNPKGWDDPVGYMTQLRRDDRGRITAEVDVDCECVTVDLSRVEWQSSPGDWRMAAGRGQIIAGVPNTLANYPWKD